MSGRVLLDTSMAAELLRGNQEVRQRVAEVDELFASVVVVGELLYGALLSSKREQNTKQVEELAMTTRLLMCDSRTAELYAAVKNQLRSKGKPIPENDIWIAATALQHDLLLADRDAHFDEVEGLKRAGW